MKKQKTRSDSPDKDIFAEFMRGADKDIFAEFMRGADKKYSFL